MKKIIKKIITLLPIFIKRQIILKRENYYRKISLKKEEFEYLENYSRKDNLVNKKNILIYHNEGLGFGGTEKILQIISNNLCSKFNIYFLFSNINKKVDRREFMDKKVNLVEFTYDHIEKETPYYMSGMSPFIKKIVAEKNIDMIISAGAGDTYYPIITITDIPIIMINIFGTPNLQKNIVSNIFISETVKKYSEKFTGPRESNQALWIPTSTPPINSKERGTEIRKSFNIKNTDFVFGRIGRNADSIFDPIGINAFKEVVKTNPSAHYIIMSAPPILEKIVSDEKIPNVHFLPPSADELDIWGFHYSLDALAHFRYDGETFGLNIAESMHAGNPIISHKSNIWNAHLEYLNDSFSRISEVGDVNSYAENMIEFINRKQHDPENWTEMKEIARQTAIQNFSEQKYAEKINNTIEKYI